jgi:acyl-CoA hydrolase
MNATLEDGRVAIPADTNPGGDVFGGWEWRKWI